MRADTKELLELLSAQIDAMGREIDVMVYESCLDLLTKRDRCSGRKSLKCPIM
ncbi:MAG: hypothetical protein ABXS92_08795 [Sulfurimonas sp.]